MDAIGIASILGLAATGAAALGVRGFIVEEGHCALLFRRGKLAGVLQPGRSWRFGRGLRARQVDLRPRWLALNGQEVLTADGLPVKISLWLRWRVTDPALMYGAGAAPDASLAAMAQLAVRAAAADLTLDLALTDRGRLAARLRADMVARAAAEGLEVLAAEARDIMLPHDLRRAWTDAARARKEGEARLERVRAETAALRNLANAARLCRSWPELTTLRWMNVAEAAAGSGGRMVLNVQAHGPASADRAEGSLE